MAIFDPAPTTIEAVVAPDWLETALGAEVRDVRTVETLITQATKLRLSLELQDAAPAVPRDICIKGVLSETGAPRSASLIETRFYRDLAGAVPVRTPPCVYAALNAAGDNGVIVMRDVIVGGATFKTALQAFTPEQAGETVTELARLHAASWQGSPLFERAAMPRFLDQIGTRPIIPGERLQALLDGPRGEPLPAAMRDAGRLQQALQALAIQVRAQPCCLVHGDAHAGNIFHDEAGGYGFVDWQILQVGEWSQDVAYHLAAVLSPEDRRAHERDLLARYLDALAGFGGPRMGMDQAWTRYRSGLIYGFYLWGITQKVDPAITHEFVRRLGLAASDLDSYDTAT